MKAMKRQRIEFLQTKQLTFRLTDLFEWKCCSEQLPMVTFD
jgi:hypothetical protein